MTKKVIIVSKSLAYGGVEDETINLFNYLDPSYHPELVVLRPPYHLASNLNQPANFTQLNCNYFAAPLSMINLFRKHLSPIPLVVITFGIYSSLVSLLAAALIPHKVSIVVYQAGMITHTIKNYPFPLIRHLFVKLLYPKADYFIVSSPHVKLDFLKFLPLAQTKITIIPSNTKVPKKMPSHRPTKIPLFIFLGRLVTVKNVQLIIKAAQLTRVPSRFFIIGDGPQKPQLISLVHRLGLASRIQFLGFVEKPWEKIATYAYTLILTSFSEGDPKVVLESASYGIPTLAVPFPGVNTIIAHQKTGYVIKNYSAISLAQAIDYLAKHPELVKKFGLAAQAKSLNRQGPVLAKRYEQIIKLL